MARERPEYPARNGGHRPLHAATVSDGKWADAFRDQSALRRRRSVDIAGWGTLPGVAVAASRRMPCRAAYRAVSGRAAHDSRLYGALRRGTLVAINALPGIVFDMDDTLLLERDYVRSGFQHVARTLEGVVGVPAQTL